jgi:hypothetical protein
MDSTERAWESDSNFGTSFDCYLKHVLGKQLKLSSIVHDDQMESKSEELAHSWLNPLESQVKPFETHIMVNRILCNILVSAVVYPH